MDELRETRDRISEEIKEMIASNMERGVTVLKSDGGYGSKGNAMPDRKILFCVITRLEVSRLLLEVDKIDRGAFVIQYPIKDTKGGMIKRRPFH